MYPVIQSLGGCSKDIKGIVRLLFVIIDDEPPRQSRRVRNEQPEYGRLEPSPRKTKPEAIEGPSPKRSRVSTTCCNCGELEPDHTTEDCPNSRLENEGYLMAIGTELFNDYQKTNHGGRDTLPQ